MPSTVLDVEVNKTVTNPTLIGAFLGSGARISRISKTALGLDSKC